MKWYAQISSAGTVQRAQSEASDSAEHLDMLTPIFSRQCMFLNAIVQSKRRLAEDVHFFGSRPVLAYESVNPG